MTAKHERVLVLGGGGVRGLAHLGILMELEKAGVRLDAILGVSAGAIIGGMYALEADAAKITSRVLTFLSSSAFRRLNLRFDIDSRPGNGKTPFFERLLNGIKRQLAMELLFRRPSLFKGEMLEILVRNLVGEHDFTQARIPFFVTALDLKRGRKVVLSEGSMVKAIVASSSVPGFFPPVRLGGDVLCDIGTIDNMPIDEARAIGATRVIAISLNAEVAAVGELPSGIDVIFRAEEIGTKLMADAKKGDADLVIEPDLEGRFWLDFADPAKVVEAGAKAARAKMPQILELLRDPAELS